MYQSFNIFDVQWSVSNSSSCHCLLPLPLFLQFHKLVTIKFLELDQVLWIQTWTTTPYSWLVFLYDSFYVLFFLLLFWYKHCPYHHICNPPWQSLLPRKVSHFFFLKVTSSTGQLCILQQSHRDIKHLRCVWFN